VPAVDAAATQKLAEDAYAAGNWSAAATQYAALVKKFPQDGALWFRLANAYAHAEQPDRAVAAYREALLQDSGLSKAWFNMGIVQLRQAAHSLMQLESAGTTHDPLRVRATEAYDAIIEILGDEAEEQVAAAPAAGPAQEPVVTAVPPVVATEPTPTTSNTPSVDASPSATETVAVEQPGKIEDALQSPTPNAAAAAHDLTPTPPAPATETVHAAPTTAPPPPAASTTGPVVAPAPSAPVATSAAGVVPATGGASRPAAAESADESTQVAGDEAATTDAMTAQAAEPATAAASVAHDATSRTPTPPTPDPAASASALDGAAASGATP